MTIGRKKATLAAAIGGLCWVALGTARATQPTGKPAPSRAAGQANTEMTQRAPAPKPLDYGKLTQEATNLLSQYIRIDTTNPPGNELPAARLLREKFLEDGIPATVWEPQPGRGVIAARLHGRGHHAKALVLLSHID